MCVCRYTVAGTHATRMSKSLKREYICMCAKEMTLTMQRFREGSKYGDENSNFANVELGRRRFPFLLHVSEIIHFPLMVLVYHTIIQ